MAFIAKNRFSGDSPELVGKTKKLFKRVICRSMRRKNSIDFRLEFKSLLIISLNSCHYSGSPLKKMK